MLKNTINEIADLDSPFDYLALVTEKICHDHSVTIDNARKLIAHKFGIPTWYQFKNQLEATVRQRKGGRELYEVIKMHEKCINLSNFDRSNLSTHSKQLLALDLQGCIALPVHFQEHLIKLSSCDWQDYIDGMDVDIHFSIKNWSEYSNFRFRDTLSVQLSEFVRFKIKSKSIFSTGVLLDKNTGMHMYARCQPDGSKLSLNEFWCQKSAPLTLSNNENFIKQTFHVIEDAVLKLPVDLGLMDVRLEFTSVNGEKFYREVFLKSKLGKLLHKKSLLNVGPKNDKFDILEIKLSLSNLYELNLN